VRAPGRRPALPVSAPCPPLACGARALSRQHACCILPGVHSQGRARAAAAGHAWVTEYGDPNNATDLPYLLAESPLQNVAVPTGSGQYPATMVTTGAPGPAPDRLGFQIA